VEMSDLEPKYQFGDRVMIVPCERFRIDLPDFFDYMQKYEGRIVTVRTIQPVLDMYISYKFFEIPSCCNEIFLELVEKRPEPKFKEGEWVKLKDHTEGLHQGMFMRFCNKFMKIESAKPSFGGWDYTVRENNALWRESWLDKLE
jgi:hypothetical protein